MMSGIQQFIGVSDEEIAEVRKVYEKTESDIQKDVKILLDWLDKQPHLPKPHDEIRLERFLVRNKFRMEQTKVKLDNYYSFKVLYPEMYAYVDFDSSEMRDIWKSLIFVPLPKLSPHLHRIFYWEPLKDQEEYFNYLNYQRYIFMVSELQLSYDYNMGAIFVCNMKHFSMKHVTKLEINHLYKAFLIFQEGFSGRLFNIHFVNLSAPVDLFVNILKRILSLKIFGKIRTHKNVETLHEVVPKECLPSEVGGIQKSARIFQDEWLKVIVDQNAFFKENIGRVSNEALRVGKLIRNDLFGTDGTFKKINLD